jgi:hypothetical protein
VTFR